MTRLNSDGEEKEEGGEEEDVAAVVVPGAREDDGLIATSIDARRCASLDGCEETARPILSPAWLGHLLLRRQRAKTRPATRKMTSSVPPQAMAMRVEVERLAPPPISVMLEEEEVSPPASAPPE